MKRLFTFVELDLHVEIQGEENLPAIVFLHGFTGSTASWREIIKVAQR